MTEGFLQKMKDVVAGATGNEQQPEGDRDRPAHNQNSGQFGDVRPASEDPYGDPADQAGQGQFGNVRPASEDPYGDPADQAGQGQFGNVRPASEDPYGDPADQKNA